MMLALTWKKTTFLTSFDPTQSLVLELNRGCNYAKGKWISDDSRPLYSGYDCKQWLSPTWSCRLTQRTDLDYEKLRWQPKDCDMVEFLASKFLKRYVGGVPNTDRKIANIASAKKFKVHSIVEWVNTQLPKFPGLKAFFRSISPRHFFNGEWNTGGTCDNTTPLSSGKEVLQDESGDPLSAGAVNGTIVKLLDITALSQLRDEGHISRYSINATPGARDCLHWCLPGVPDTWNEILFAQI
ncbi:protein trichome birefringence-like 16 [Henckelia pumila]|uniref:protein trichome birefringence-like 16 n=1 Tax=Henckelia pumila TaxID=405737 RepID=UPI003C6DFB9F